MNTTRFASHIVAAAFAGAAIMAHAGLKYWDNPAFKDYDVGDYVQDGLVVNYDGIRNAGPNADHNPNAMTWVNCANPGTYDATRYSTNGTVGASASATAAAWNQDASRGSWTDKGFVFDKDANFYQPSAFAIPTTYTIQSLVDATPGNQNGIGYIMCSWNANNWAYCSLGIRSSNFNYGGGNVANTFYLVSGSIGKRPAMRGSGSIRFTYATAINNANDGVLFSETTAPWNAAYADTSYGHAYDSSKAGTAYTYSNGFCIGGHYPRTDEMFKGTIKNYRFYNRCLSDAEVLWNRVVDEARYFGRGREITVIPATNVVEATTIPGVRDYHYAIDAEGFTFTAPAQKTVDGKRYTCSGYTLATWNGSTWGSPVPHDGEFSYTATDPTALVRITWQYAAATGEGKLKTYDVGDYVAGAAIHYDGIRNVGANADHDPNTTNWVNLGTAGTSMNLSHRKYGYGDPGAWDGDGYWFTDTPKFVSTSQVSWPATYTVQVLLDANTDDQQRNDTAMYVYSVSWNRIAMALYGKRKDIELHTQKESAQPYGPYLGGTSFQYVNGFVDSNAKTSAIFSATSIPTSGNNVKGYTTMDSAVGNNTIAVGGFGGAADQDLVGKIKSIRFYFDRVLTEAELEQNRKVDEYRFFGRYTAPNVLVQSTYSYLEGYDKCGVYEVDGSYTFVAPATVEHGGITYACDGYIIETQDGIGWANATHYTGTSYLYDTSAGTIRLTWKWKATHGLRTAANYSFDDLSPAGLALHYDGLLNAGVDVARSTTATKWVNLGSRPDMDLTRATSGSDATAIGGWISNGYRFGGKAQFNSAGGKQWPTTFSAQVLVDAKHEDNGDVDGTEKGHYIAATTWGMFGMVAYGKGRSARFQVQSLGNSQNNPHFVTEEGIDYMTAIHDAKSKAAVVFPGTKAPTSGAAADGYKSFGTFNGIENNAFRLGGWGGGASSGQCLVGTFYTFRYYDRVLTEEELVRNRNVDAVRYFNALGVTNLVVEVEAGVDFNATPAPGAYFVEGSYEFAAAPGTDTPTRYKLQDWNEASGKWDNARYVNSTAFTYEAADATAAKMKLTWCKTKAFMLIVR